MKGRKYNATLHLLTEKLLFYRAMIEWCLEVNVSFNLCPPAAARLNFVAAHLFHLENRNFQPETSASCRRYPERR